MKLFLFGVYFMLYFIDTAETSTCVEKIYTPTNIFATIGFSRHKRRTPTLQQIICTNVDQDFILDFKYEVRPYRQDLWIKDSLIPKLPTNSSLSKFTHIKSLKIMDVGLEEIELGAFNELVQLKELELSGNKLTKISNGDFNNLKELETLSINGNKISEIGENSFVGLDKLVYLRLDENRFISFRENLFSDLTHLQDLWISKNPLKQFSNSEFPSLRSITAIETHLKSLKIDFAQSPLDTVKFSLGKLEEVDFVKFPKMQVIHLEKNQISFVLNWDKLNSQSVILNHNNITSFDISENIVNLDLSHNQIKIIGNTFLNQTKKIKELNLAFNKISEIKSEQLRDLTKLQILNLDHNEITIVQENALINNPRLRKLYLSHNKIETLAVNAFSGLDNLDLLDISGNNLRKLESPILLELKKADVVIGNTDIDWDYIKVLLTSSDDLSLQLDEQFWICNNVSGNEDVYKIKYVTKYNVNNIKCHLKNNGKGSLTIRK